MLVPMLMFQIVAFAMLVGWLLVGLSLSLLIGRRGYDGFSWLVLGALLGPLAIVLAIETGLRSKAQEPRVLAGGPAGAGPVDVLVGYDESPEARAAASRAVELFGPRMGRLTLATVIPFDGGREGERLAVAALERQARHMAPLQPSFEVLGGHPSHVLEQLTRDEGYDLLVIGTRGAGRAKALLGSAASKLARRTDVPVLLVGAEAALRSAEAPVARRDRVS